MGVNYTTLFSQIGSILARINTDIAAQKQLVSGSTGRLQKILAQYALQPTLVSGISAAMSSAVSQLQQQESALLAFINTTLEGQQTTLSAPSNSVSTILGLLVDNMIANSQSVTPNVATVSSVAAASGNVGNGTVILLSTNQNFPSGGVDQRMNAEAVRIVCTGDQSSGFAPGGEAFSASGYPSQGQNGVNYSYLPNGSGTAPVNTANGNGNLLTNGSFDSYAGSTFSGWTVESLPVGTWYAWITTVTGGVETLPSPISAGVAVTTGQAITWTLPSQASGTTMNLYLSTSATQPGALQMTGLTATSVSTTKFVNGTPPPTTGSAGPSAAITGVAYSPGSTVYQDTQNTVPATGGGALWLAPNSGGVIAITQSVGNISPNAALAACAWLAQLNCTAGSTLTILMEGINSTPAITLFSGDPSTLTEKYAMKSVAGWPSAITQQARLTIRWSNSSTAGSTAIVLVDQMAVAKMVTLGYNQIAIFRGTVDFAIGDTFTFTATNTYAGLFQTGFGQFLGTELPSSSTPTISDSLVA